MTSDATERWLAISAQSPIGPKESGGIVPGNAEPTQDVGPGQLRMAYWTDSNAVVLIDSIDDALALARVIPVTLESGVEDSTAVVVEDGASPLHGPITTWPQKSVVLPLAVLGEALASITTEQLSLLKATVGNTGALASGLRVGRRDPALSSGAALAIDDLFDALDVLQHGPRLQPVSRETVNTLAIPLPVIMSALHIPQPRAMAVRLGKEPLTPDEATNLAAAANVPLQDVEAALAPLPEDLERELQEPRWRAAIRQRATDGNEQWARVRLGYEAYQLAARETGQGRQLWRQRLDAVLTAGAR